MNKLEIFIGEEFATLPVAPIAAYISKYGKDRPFPIYVPSVYDVTEVAIPGATVVLHTEQDQALIILEGVVAYWNPLLPIKIIGRLGTVVYSISLTDDLAQREPIPVHRKARTTVPTLTDWSTQTRPKCFQIPFSDVGPLYTGGNVFKFCLVPNVPIPLIALGILRAITILGARNAPIEYSICARDDIMGAILLWLKEDKMRKLTILGMKSGTSDVSLDVDALRRLQHIRMLIGSSVSLTALLKQFKPLIGKYMGVIYFVSLMSISDSGQDLKRLQCLGDTYSMTTRGVVPVNTALENGYSKKWTRPCRDTNDYVLAGSYENRNRTQGVVNYFY